jgi:hypothetical protein
LSGQRKIHFSVCPFLSSIVSSGSARVYLRPSKGVPMPFRTGQQGMNTWRHVAET